MSIEICVESYGVLIQALDACWLQPITGHSRKVNGPSSIPVAEPTAMSSRDTTFGSQVREAVDQLGYEAAEALWLVDTCKLSYDLAAEHIGCTSDQVGQRVADARRLIRQSL